MAKSAQADEGTKELNPSEDLLLDDPENSAPEEKITASKLKDVSKKEMDATKLYLKEIEFSELLTADEEKHYTRLAQAGDEKSRAKMIECNPVSYTHLRSPRDS